jgi:hypothetical protein
MQMKAKGEFDKMAVCPICGERIFTGYKGVAFLGRCLSGHLLLHGSTRLTDKAQGGTG